MPRKQETPAAAILRYFETADLPSAELMLDLSRAAVAKRRPKAVAKPAAASGAGQAVAPRTRKPRTQTTVSAGAAALPGMQETVG